MWINTCFIFGFNFNGIGNIGYFCINTFYNTYLGFKRTTTRVFNARSDKLYIIQNSIQFKLDVLPFYRVLSIIVGKEYHVWTFD